MATKQAVLKQLDGIAFAAKGNSDHWVMMDGSESFGGSNAASRPKELVLFALGGCTASDVVGILKKKRVSLSGFEMRLTGHEAEEHPRVFTDIHVEYIFYGENINPKDVKRAIELSTTKYCSVSAMLKPNVSITHSYRIEATATSVAGEELVSQN
ncbi:MAG: OsmC family protein [Ignavibacteriae bacterium]|nr:OsmC family protein [Ignavibacteriota bacterium]